MPTHEGNPPPEPHAGRSRVSIAGMMLAVALACVGLAPLANPSHEWLVALAYLRVGALTAATFLARFGPAKGSGWWFGFATFGWASLVIRIPSLWYPTNGTPLEILGVDIADPTRWAGVRVAEFMSPGHGTLNQRFAVAVTSVVSFWFTLISATLGGLLGLALDRRREARAQSPRMK